MSQDTDLVTAIEARLFDVADLPDSRHRDLENEGFESDNRFADPWMRVTHLFGAEQLRTLPAVGGRLVKSGFTQVDFYVQPKTGRQRLDELTDAVRDAFRSDLALSVNGLTLRILSSKRSGGRMNGKWFFDHVDVFWELRAVNPS